MKKILLLLILFLLLTGCKKEDVINISCSCGILKDEQLDSILIDISIEDFNNLGFEYGDSINVYFSNGHELVDIPYYSDNYVKKGEPFICDDLNNTHPLITKLFIGLWSEFELKDDDSVIINLNKKAKYLLLQNTLNQEYSNELSDYKNIEAFSNYRVIETSNLKENIIYRGASPYDDTYNRKKYVNELMEKSGIKYVIDLENSEEEYIEYEIENNSFIKNMYFNNNIVFLDLPNDFDSVEYREALAKGLRRMIDNEGPYYICCLDGSKKTGFVCFLLESLVNSSYGDIRDDFMKTYDNYYGINKKTDSKKYKILENFYLDEFVEYVKKPLNKGVYNYLMDCGMNDSEIESLINMLSK